MKSEKENKDWLNDNEALKQVNPANPFVTPAGYFDNLADRILSLKNLDELVDNGSTRGFIVPENYFEELTGNIESRLFIENSTGTTEAGFGVPDGYFDTLGQQIQSRIFVEEALSGTDENFDIPHGYFDNLTENILAKTAYAPKPESNIFENKGIVRKLFASTAFKYATAACFALVLGGGILLNEFSSDPVSEHNNSFLHKQLSTVSVDEIKSYLQLNEDASDTQQSDAVQGASVDDDKLKNDLQDYVDSVQ